MFAKVLTPLNEGEPQKNYADLSSIFSQQYTDSDYKIMQQFTILQKIIRKNHFKKSYLAVSFQFHHNAVDSEFET